MIKRINVMLLIVLLIMLPGVSLAQDDYPETRRVTVDSDAGSMSIIVPDGWQALITPEEVGNYGSMTNRVRVPEGEARTEIQIIFRNVAELLSVLDSPVDTAAENPAYDYLSKYTVWSGNEGRGVYNTPLALESNGIPAALMLYVEHTDAPRFGADVDVVLSLSLAFYLGNDSMLIMLLDGPVDESEGLLSLWVDVLQTVEINDEALAFIGDLSDLL
ncbi:MAG TPA: hypothetical protein VJZ27_11535, partial [Aggregatilineales bacterium]|nr:hypothetical protein [Aggregatilineales bacterium]